MLQFSRNASILSLQATVSSGIVLAVAGLAVPAMAQGSQQDRSIRWNSGVTEQFHAMSPAKVQTELDRLAKRGPRTHVVVHFQSPITEQDREQLAAAGLVLLSPLGGYSYFAAVSGDADAGAIVRRTSLSVSEVGLNQKIHEDLAQGLIRPWMTTRSAARGDAQIQGMLDSGMVPAEEFAARGIDPRIAVLVMFYKDIDYRLEGKRIAKELGAVIASDIYSVNTVVMHLPLSKLDALAMNDSVQWVEPPLPPMQDTNAENRMLTGVDTVNASPYNLLGDGVNVMVFDGGRVWPHTDFGSRLIEAEVDGEYSRHATHVAGTIGGDGTILGTNRGMEPAVELFSYAFEVEGGLSAGFLYSDPGDIEADYAAAISLYGIDIANNSIGTNIESNGYPCEWTGNYGITSALIDSIIYGALGESPCIIWANGNERSRQRCLGDDMGNHGEYYSTAPPACAKNSIAVGSVDSDTDLISYFSSWGPTDDGRTKPDISAPGCESVEGVGVTSTDLNDGSITLCGTSMAAPTVTGLSALLVEQYRITNPGQPDFRNATLKALLANTAVDRGNEGPDFSYGYGSVRADAAVDAIINGQVLGAEVAQGGVYRFAVEVAPENHQLKITMAWDDVPGTPNTFDVLINDLDIRVLDADGNEYLPWTLDPNHPEVGAVQTRADHRNNLEQVQINNPAPGAYTIEVSGYNIASGGTQSFGVVANGDLQACSSAGFVAFDTSVTRCDDQTQVTVTDCDLNASDTEIDTVDILLTSNTQPSGMIVTLAETAANSAKFTGTFTHGSSGSVDLLVSDGESVSAIYSDLDNGSGASVEAIATMTVDCTPPMALSNSVTDLWYNHFVVDLDINEPVHCRVLYGESVGSMNSVAGSIAYLASSHHILIDELAEQTRYVYALELTDTAGAVTFDDNHGSGYPVTTIQGPIAIYEFLVDDTDPGWDRTGEWEFGQPTGILGNPAQASTGTNILGYNLDGYFPWHMEEEYLTSEVMDFTGVYEIRLGFERWLGMVPDVFNNASIRYRIGDAEWEEIWHFVGGRMAPTEWSHITYLLSDAVSNQPEVQFRWVMGTSDIHIDECGWNLDDIVLTGVVPPTPCIADLNGDGILNFFDISEFLAAYGEQDPLADFSHDGVLSFFDISLFLNAFSAGCP